MTALRMTLAGQPATKKNSQRVIKIKRKGGKGFIKLLPSEAYEKYEADCLKQIDGRLKLEIGYPVNVQCVYYMKTRRAVDLSNLIEASHDILVKAGVLSDDNRNIIASVDGSRVFYDRRNPRVEITITDAEESYTQWDTKARKRRE